MLQQSRYVIITNIERFEHHLRSGLLDSGQTATVTALLAEARAALHEYDRHATLMRHPPVAESGIGPA